MPKSAEYSRYAATLRRFSISLSQATIWFQLGMLWDAMILGSLLRQTTYVDVLSREA